MEKDTTASPHNPANADNRAEPHTHPLHRTIAAFPHLPGVYIFKDDGGGILYVGKAIDLRKRVGSYFRTASPTNVKTRILLARASDLEYVVTSNEKEALLLEASLIKKHRPRYNVLLRDDKNYPAIRIDPREPFPRIEVVRRFQKDGALYFGPYHSAYAMRETLRLLNQLFPLRQCKGKKLVPRERPCLNYSMGRCLGACAGKISQEDYRKMVDEVILFLQGKADVLQQQLTQRMEEASESLEFERAAFYRDRLRGVASMLEKQLVVSDRFLNQDVLGIHQGTEGTEVAVLFVRQGAIVGQRNFDLEDAQGEPEELLAAFIQQFYEKGRYIPDEIVVPDLLEAHQSIEEWLTELRGKRVRIWPPKRGDRKRLADLALHNAQERYASRRKWEHRDLSLLESLQRILRLPRVPSRMACVDISNIQGRHAVGAVVVFDGGQPDKSSYRRFRVRGKDQPDDPAMMAEVMERFFKEEPELAAGLDLLAVDGGKSQLNRIHQLMKDLDMVDHLPLISIAKEKESDVGDKGRGLYEKIYLPGRKNPVFLTRYQDILHLLQRLRDEAHRFAISHYQSRHRSDLLTSALDAIPGVGPHRRQLLLQHFGSVDALEKAGLEEIKNVPGIPESLAAVIVDSLRNAKPADGDSQQ